MQLYSYFRSSAAYRMRIALNLKGLDYEQVAVDLPGGVHREAAFGAVNPQRLVPALIDGCLPELPPGVVSRVCDDGAVRARGRLTVDHASGDTERQGFE